MAKSNLAKLLKADLPAAAELIRKKGRRGDSILAHITPREAEKLKAEGGSGTINPETGLPEFYDGFDFGSMDFNLPSEIAGPIEAGAADYSSFLPSTYAGSLVPFSTTGISGPMGQAPGGDILDLQLALRDAAANYNNQPGTPPIPFSAQEMRAAYGGTPETVSAYAPTTTAATTEAVTPEQAAEGAKTEEQKRAEAAAKPGMLDKLQESITKDPLKALIAALGIGGMGMSYMRAQQQGKDYANKIANAYGQAAAQTRQLAQPFMQQGGQQLGQAVAGQLSAANQQQLEAARAQAAQQVARSGGVATAQAQRAIEDARQRLIQNQQNAALALLGAGTPLISTAIQQQLSGTTQGLGTQLQLSQQAGQAASNLVSQLALLYGRS